MRQTRANCWRSRRHKAVRRTSRRTLWFEQLENRSLLATFTVNSLIDAPVAMPNDAPGTLRQAIFDANTSDGPDTVEFDGALTTNGPATILLAQGELMIGESVSILGPGTSLLTIDAAQQSRIFNITAPTGDVTFLGLTLTGGRTAGDDLAAGISTFSGGAIRSLTSGTVSLGAISISGNRTMGDFARGGGIFCVGDLVLNDSTVSDNRTMGEPGRGGGVWVGGNVTLTRSAITGNHTAGSRGAGIYALNGDVSLSQSTVSGNSSIGSLYTSSGGGGAGIFALNGDVSLSHSSVCENSTGLSYGGGAGIATWSYGSRVTLSTSSVCGNSTAGNDAYGGGILSGGSVHLVDSTVSGNSTSGDNAFGGGIAGQGPVTVVSSTIAGNTTSGNSAGGAGIFGFRRITLRESTVSGNMTMGSNSPGGGIYGRDQIIIYESTVTNNQAEHITSVGGGVYQRDAASYYAPVIRGSVLAGNVAGGGSLDFKPDSEKTPVVNFSLIGVADGLTFDGNLGNLSGTAAAPLDPLLGELADNGGPTMTHSLLFGSPAIDAGNLNFDPSDPDGDPGTDDAVPHDQRGQPFSRVFDGSRTGIARVDIGAFESQPKGIYGDYNLDGGNDAADYVVWRKALGSPVEAPFVGADGDGDSSVDVGDYDVWREDFGEVLLGTGTSHGSKEGPSDNLHAPAFGVMSASDTAVMTTGQSVTHISPLKTFAPGQFDATTLRDANVAAHHPRSSWRFVNSQARKLRQYLEAIRSDVNILSLLPATDQVEQHLDQESIVVGTHVTHGRRANEVDRNLAALKEDLIAGRTEKTVQSGVT